MAIVGIGIDLVDLDRAERLLDRHGDRALRRLLSPAERAYVKGMVAPARHFAVRLAAKEAVYKALQTLPGAAGIGWRDIEVLRATGGRPGIQLHGNAARVAAALGPHWIHVSLTHTESTAGAVAVVERREELRREELQREELQREELQREELQREELQREELQREELRRDSGT